MARPTRLASTPSQDRHYVTDIHATLLHQLGLDPRRLEVPGHKRLEIDFGEADPADHRVRPETSTSGNLLESVKVENGRGTSLTVVG